MPINRKKNLLEELADLSKPTQDFDPENLDGFNTNLSPSDQSDSDEEFDGREHYVSVGESKLRRQQALTIDDPKYSGKRTSREDLFRTDDSHDGVISDGDSSNTDDEHLSANSEADFNDNQSSMTQSEDELGPDSDGTTGNESFNGDSGADLGGSTNITDQLRQLEEEEKSLMQTLSSSASTEIEKGQHVQNQLQIYDQLLDLRIRAQKINVLAQRFPLPQNYVSILSQPFPAFESAMENAQNQVAALLDELVELRIELINRNATVDNVLHNVISKKRKRPDDDAPMDSDSAWDLSNEISTEFKGYRNESLEKWSNKIQLANGISTKKTFKAINQSIVTQISQILSDRERLVKRTQLKRFPDTIVGLDFDREEALSMKAESVQNDGDESEAMSSGQQYISELFDDTDFYQMQLRELIESRISRSEDMLDIAGTWATIKSLSNQTKQRKKVDRRASKGRKIRYQVHEKLQNFMGPIPAGTWHEGMVDELFGGLFGVRTGSSIEEEQRKRQQQEEEQQLKAAVEKVGSIRLFG
ncbi:apoptosis-antagonizing transcription factor [Paraphysoderma sedebokerense]|nr:apoptosis-antagonizing transcription factor [Paraphysoderma sedebokerense]